MSTEYVDRYGSDLAQRIRVPGIFDQNASPGTAANPFASWNHVLIYYCSSDNWLGRTDDVEYVEGGNRLSVHHQGHTIIAAVRDILRKASPADPIWRSDDGEVDMPDLDLASEVVLSGSSAGSIGAIHHADWFFEVLPYTVDERLVLDGEITFTDDVIADFGLESTVVPGCRATTTSYIDFRNVEQQRNEIWPWYSDMNAFVQEDCRAAHLDVAGPEPEQCLVSSYLLGGAGGGFVDTPTFVRVDLTDAVQSRRLDCTNLPGATNFHMLARASVEEMFDSTSSAVEAVFGPACAQHRAILYPEGRAQTTQDRVIDSMGSWSTEGSSVNVLEAIDLWRSGGRLRHLDSTVGPVSVCM
jgi:hypothetical protein